jgi:hypothetical protein
MFPPEFSIEAHVYAQGPLDDTETDRTAERRQRTVVEVNILNSG